MSTYYKYRIKCDTENNWQHWILSSTSPEPTKCPNDTSHTVNTVLTSVVETISENKVTIKEETIETGGHFGTRTVDLTISPTASNTIEMWWPYPISATVLKFTTIDEMIGDTLSLTIGPDTIVGGLLASAPSVNSYEATVTYNSDDVVEYLHPSLGNQIYTCLQTATSNEPPGTATYWQHGYPLTASSTALTYISAGFDVALFNGVTKDDLGETILVDQPNAKIYVENAPSNSYSPGTYIMMTVYHLKNYNIGYRSNYVIGESKIGGSYIPANTKVKITYNNNSNTEKRIVGSVEYLY